jgi:hypothetical protein
MIFIFIRQALDMDVLANVLVVDGRKDEDIISMVPTVMPPPAQLEDRPEPESEPGSAPELDDAVSEVASEPEFRSEPMPQPSILATATIIEVVPDDALIAFEDVPVLESEPVGEPEPIPEVVSTPAVEAIPDSVAPVLPSEALQHESASVPVVDGDLTNDDVPAVLEDAAEPGPSPLAVLIVDDTILEDAVEQESTLDQDKIDIDGKTATESGATPAVPTLSTEEVSIPLCILLINNINTYSSCSGFGFGFGCTTSGRWGEYHSFGIHADAPSHYSSDPSFSHHFRARARTGHGVIHHRRDTHSSQAPSRARTGGTRVR